LLAKYNCTHAPLASSETAEAIVYPGLLILLLTACNQAPSSVVQTAAVETVSAAMTSVGASPATQPPSTPIATAAEPAPAPPMTPPHLLALPDPTAYTWAMVMTGSIGPRPATRRWTIGCSSSSKPDRSGR